MFLASNCLLIYTILLVCFIWFIFDSRGRRDDDKANIFVWITVPTTIALEIVMLVWEIRNQCPGGDKGTLKNGN